jgi:hypothetical protein
MGPVAAAQGDAGAVVEQDGVLEFEPRATATGSPHLER